MTEEKSTIVIALGVMALVAMVGMPMSTVVLDCLMVMNLVLSLLIVLSVLFYAKKVKESASFPTILLTVTIFDLALNIASTRLILTRGIAFDGKIIKLFSPFVIPDETASLLAAGFVAFILCAAVYAVVLNGGAGRIAEAAARFRLNILPEKLAAIETKLDSGAVSQAEAAAGKNTLRREGDFYEAMNGVSRFISGSILVLIFITVANVVGGILIGTRLHGEEFGEAMKIYMPLSIGAGYLFLFPVILISISAGIIVMRSVSEGKKWPD